MNATYRIQTIDIAQFNKLLANAQKKATKLGVLPITATFGNPYKVEVTERGVTRFLTMTEVTITGATPKFEGWKLVGVVSPLKTDTGEILPIVTTVPGETVQTRAQTRDPLWCDHCKVRRDRLESFIVCHDDGTERQVGRNCLGDFLGDPKMSPAGLANLLNTLASISNSVAEWSRGPRRFDSESLDLVLATTLACIRNHGWVSSKEAFATGKVSTRHYVQLAMQAFLSRPDEPMDSPAYLAWFDLYRPQVADLPVDSDFANASKYRENLEVILDTKEEAEGLNDYLQAIRILQFAGAVNLKAMGIAVSIVPMVDRELNVTTDPVKAMILAANKTSKFVGTPKKREVFAGLTFIENFNSNQGFSIATFVSPDGDIIKMFSHQALLPGTKVNIKATTVRHDTYKGINQTIVNRPVVTAC